MQKVTIHTDGSCLGNPGPGGWAAVLKLDGQDYRKEFAGGYKLTTNNRMQAGAEAVVMGLPLTLDGEESLTTRQIRNVTERLKRRVPLPFFFMMEALSSAEAWSDLREAGLKLSKRKAVLDQQAAVRILSSFLSLAPQDRRQA